jgi:tetratricopeptide (TPR) repeat protein
LLFGVLYGSSVIGLYAFLGRVGAPTFYDKLLGVPILNLSIQVIDRAARTWLKRLDPVSIGRTLSPQRRNLAYMSMWSLVFVVMLRSTAAAVTLARADVLSSLGRMDEAVVRYHEVLNADPENVVALNKLGFALIQIGRASDAETTLGRAVALGPEDAETHNNLGLAMMQQGRAADAVAPLRRAIQIRPGYAEAHYNLSQALISAARPIEAASVLRDALRIRPEWPTALAALAWIHATQSDAAVYNPAEAVRLATHAANLTGQREVPVLDALAAAYAAAGRYDDATRAAETAETLAVADRARPELVEDIRARLTLYRSGHALVNAR